MRTVIPWVSANRIPGDSWRQLNSAIAGVGLNLNPFRPPVEKNIRALSEVEYTQWKSVKKESTTQAIAGGMSDNPMGPYKILSNFLEAAGEKHYVWRRPCHYDTEGH
jgi:hypothetical protein